MKTFGVRGEFITLGQLVKMLGIASTGGEAKIYIFESGIQVNGEPESRRGRKLRPGDVVDLPDSGTYTLVTEPDAESDEDSFD
jgi:ribosome-associated protein